ncbi:hypothetical protein J5J10_12390 [Ciceribacter sp. L1K23]|uniref:hypothetical protein n=1 Tax=Ciceribacter sp. L1K23 TaxID=2820276 RepID=UPI001B8198BA|nr:hypothetical protein [Ciceribacter sp. L1K23]MBR0556478.1 hypothetical protein [Ciceribacter sp. L1K23]
MTRRKRRAGVTLRAAGLVAAHLAASAAMAVEWRHHANARFGYEIEVPADFLIASSADNGDGDTFESADKTAELRVWGTSVAEGDFRAEADDRRNTASFVDGWQISYEKTTDRWTSYSGTKDGRVIYVRGIALCDGEAAFFQLVYPQAQLAVYDAVVSHLVDTLKPADGCEP